MDESPLSWLRRLLVLGLSLVTTQSSSQIIPDDDEAESPRVHIQQSPIPGLHEAAFGSTIYYLSPDRRYVLIGELFDVSGNLNLTQARRQHDRLRVLNSLASDYLISLLPKEPSRRKLFVFIDLDCSFCGRFHTDATELLKKGFEVHYLLHANIDDAESWARAQAVICAEDQPAAITQALNRRGDDPRTAPPQKACDSVALTLHQKVTRAIGVEVFPTIITDSGRVIVGYTGHEWLINKAEASEPPPAEWSMDKFNRLRQLVDEIPEGVGG